MHTTKLIEKNVCYNLESGEQNRNQSLLNNILGTQNADSKIKVIQGVQIEEVRPGTGKKAESGKKIKVQYVGKLKSNNKVFDASRDRPFSFRLGRSEVIKGWDIGCAGMLVGGKRILTIPPEKAYGNKGAPPSIPPKATLIFEVTLLDVA